MALKAELPPYTEVTEDGIVAAHPPDSCETEKGPTTRLYDDDGNEHFLAPPETAKDLVVEVLRVEDDPSLNPWTFRVCFLGIGLSIFGGTLSTIYYFKPQNVSVSTLFLAIVSFALGELMSYLIPRVGLIGRLFNPHPFNKKEHAAIFIMSSSAANGALAVEVLAASKLFYAKSPNPIIGILLILTSQSLGYGFAGFLRNTLVYPTKMLYPSLLPINSLLETLHGKNSQNKKRLQVFYIGFTVLFCWEFFPEYIAPILTGLSVFCLAKRDSRVFTNLFGGSNGNEGLGFLSLSFDWQYITSMPMWLPLQTLCNTLVGYVLSLVVLMCVYYSNAWNARNFPFISQSLFTAESNGTNYVPFNQTAILGKDLLVDEHLVEKVGLPYFTGSEMVFVLANNLAITATITHLFLWNYSDIKSAWSFATWANIKNNMNLMNWNVRFWQANDTRRATNETDPHYQLMLSYKDAPNWWYGVVLILSILFGLITIYLSKSTLPWWGFLISIGLSAVCVLFFGAQTAMTGFSFSVLPVIQMIGGYLHPGRPVANMYFCLFGSNCVDQGKRLLLDLKFAQYAHLSPRCTFAMQMVGTVIGSIFSYIIMDIITTNQRDILLSIEGTNVWSGQAVQAYNAIAIAWGGLSKQLFSIGSRYQIVPLGFIIGFFLPFPFYLIHRFAPKLRADYWNTAIIAFYICSPSSSVLSFYIVGFTSQFYLRKYKPNWFIKYNYILSAAMDGGTQVVVFLLTFAVFGASGKAVTFPPYWGNNFQSGNYDYCMKTD